MRCRFRRWLRRLAFRRKVLWQVQYGWRAFAMFSRGARQYGLHVAQQRRKMCISML
jgi:hypothetical protein